MDPHLRLRVESAEAGRACRAADIVAAVQAAAGGGDAAAGCRLPPVRVLAHQLGISKNTVSAAYDELVAQGVVESRERQGYYVKGAVEGSRVKRARAAPAPELQPATIDEATCRAADVVPLGNVFVDPELLPRERLSDCFRSVLRTPGIHSFYDAQGFPPLREAIAARLERRGIAARAEQVIITTGSQQALDIVCRALVDKRLATENPAYSMGKRLFEMAGVEVMGLPFSPFVGVDLERWGALLREGRPAMLYLTSSFQNPTGYSYSTAELVGLLELARALGFGILEDDWGSDMLSFSEFRPPLRAIGGEQVLYMNSFTKKLLPSLRLGYLVASEQTVAPLVEAKRVATLGHPTLVEAALFEFLDRGYFDTHLEALQRELDRRYRLCLELLRSTMPAEVRWTTPGGGPILWLELPRAVGLPQLQRALAARKVHINLATASFFGEPHLHGFRLSYAYPTPAQLERGIEVLADELRRELAARG